MEIQWLFFVPALLLLFYPVDHAINERVRLRTFLQIEGRTWWKFPWLWLDPLRAVIGGWLLRLSWVVEPPLEGPFKHIEMGGTVLVMMVAVIVQTHTRRKDNAFLAPIGYVVGLIFVLLPPLVATLVIAMAFACMMISRLWAVFFMAGAAGSLFIGKLLGGGLWMLGAAAAMSLPLAMSYAMRKALLVPVRGQRAAMGFPKR